MGGEEQSETQDSQVSSLVQQVHSLFQKLPDFSSFALTQITCLAFTSTAHGLKLYVFFLKTQCIFYILQRRFSDHLPSCDKIKGWLPSLDFYLTLRITIVEYSSYSWFCVWLFATLWTVAHQALLSMGFSREEYWSGVPCPPPGDLPDSGIKPTSPMSPALAGGFFTINTTWEAHVL